jgi:hypothetical protein
MNGKLPASVSDFHREEEEGGCFEEGSGLDRAGVSQDSAELTLGSRWGLSVAGGCKIRAIALFG